MRFVSEIAGEEDKADSRVTYVGRYALLPVTTVQNPLYEQITRRRFDALAAETAAFSAAGIEVLLRQRSARGGDCRAAAAQLAAEMRAAIAAMLQVIARRA